MELLNEASLLRHYLARLERNEINFLASRPRHDTRVQQAIRDLMASKDMNAKVAAAKRLWKALFSAAMSFLDPDTRGYHDLFRYLDVFVEFEELIFASDSFYRDHTLHPLWVYFLGEYLQSEERYKFLFVTDNETDAFGNVEKVYSELTRQIGVDFPILSIMNSVKEETRLRPAAFCVASLCHDLGYPVKKIGKIADMLRKVYPYFKLESSSVLSIQFATVQQHDIRCFLNRLALDQLDLSGFGSDILAERHQANKILRKLFGNGNEEDIDKLVLRMTAADITEAVARWNTVLTQDERSLLKGLMSNYIFRSTINNSLFHQLADSFAAQDHGILSSYLLYLLLPAFVDAEVPDTQGNWQVRAVPGVMAANVKLGVLRSIAYHTLPHWSIHSLKQDTANSGAFLILMDELEEFSRISRANQNRQFVEEFCDTYLDTHDDFLQVRFVFKHAQLSYLDPEKAFKGKCQRMLRLFNFRKLDQACRIEIVMEGQLPWNKHIYLMRIADKRMEIEIDGRGQALFDYLKDEDFFEVDAMFDLDAASED